MSTEIAVCIGILLAATLLWWFTRRPAGAGALDAVLREDPILLDVRRPDEVARSSVSGAAHIPVAELEDRLQELEHGRLVVVYCASGVRSRRAAAVLTAGGFQVHDAGTVRAVAAAIARVQSAGAPTSTPDSRE